MKKVICLTFVLIFGALGVSMAESTSADAWATVTPKQELQEQLRRNQVENYLKRNFPRPSVWKIVARERLADNSVAYMLENADKDRLEFKACAGSLQGNLILDDTVKVEQKGRVYPGEPECSVDIYRH